jgi:hypothetical protein
VALGATVLTSSYDNSDQAATYTTASISPAANSILWIPMSSYGTATAPLVTPSGLTGVTYTNRHDLSDGVTWAGDWTAVCGSAPGTGALTLTVAAAALGCAGAVVEITGWAPNYYVQSAIGGGPGDTAANTTGTVTLANAYSSSGNRGFSYFAHRANEGTTFRTNWSELADNASSAPARAHELQWRNDGTNETTATATWTTSSRWQGIAVEFAAFVGSPALNINQTLTTSLYW